MKKLLIIGQLPPPYHGSNVMAQNMVKALKNKNHSIFFISKNFSKTIDDIGKVSLRKILRTMFLFFEISIKIILNKPSLCIYFPAVGKSAFFFDFLYLLLIKKLRVPYVLRFGGKGYSLIEKEGYIWKKIVKSALSNAIGGIVLGNNMKWDVKSYINEKRLINVPNGVPNPINQRVKKSEQRIIILFLSNLIPSKGPFEVLKAAKIALKENKNLFFILAGSASSRFFNEELHSYIIKNDIKKFVKLLGGVNGKLKEYLFNSSDIFVFPTYYEQEVFGTVNIEAMSYGLPVISSNEGAIPEIVQDGITGFIVNPKSPEEIAEKILLLANDPLLRKNMGANGKEKYQQKYNLNAHAENLDKAVGTFLKFAQDDKINKG